MKRGTQRGPRAPRDQVQVHRDEGLLPPDELTDPQGRGELLVRFVRAREPFTVAGRGAPFDFQRARVVAADISGGNLHGADLTYATFSGVTAARADLSRVGLRFAELVEVDLTACSLRSACLADAKLRDTSLVRADLRGADFRRAWLGHVDLSFADLDGADFSGSDLRGCLLNGLGEPRATVAGVVLDSEAIDGSGWSQADLRRWVSAGAQVADVRALRPELRAAVLGDVEGLTLTLDARLHEFDSTAMTLLVANELGLESGVVVTGRSEPDAPAPAFIRINGPRAEDLLRIAQAFYDRVWRSTNSVSKTAAVQRSMSTGMATLLGRLDEMRDGWSGTTVRHAELDGMAARTALARAELATRAQELDRRPALQHVLRGLFSDEKLRAWVAVTYGPQVEDELPGRVASHAEVADAVVRVLDSRGWVDAAFFARLVECAPDQGEVILKVAAKWGVTA